MEYNNDPSLISANMRLNVENEGLIRSINLLRESNEFLKSIILEMVKYGKD